MSPLNMPQTRPVYTWTPPADKHDWRALESAGMLTVTEPPKVPDNARHRRLTRNGADRFYLGLPA
jgi:hypothetical protein